MARALARPTACTHYVAGPLSRSKFKETPTGQVSKFALKGRVVVLISSSRVRPPAARAASVVGVFTGPLGSRVPRASWGPRASSRHPVVPPARHLLDIGPRMRNNSMRPNMQELRRHEVYVTPKGRALAERYWQHISHTDKSGGHK